MVQVADHHPFQSLIHRLQKRRQYDPAAIGPGVVALANNLHAELLG